MKATRNRENEDRVPPIEEVPQGVLLYTKPQMAALLQVSIRCLTDMMRRGEVGYLKFRGKLVRFRASQVLRRLKETTYVCHKPKGDEAIGNRQ